MPILTESSTSDVSQNGQSNEVDETLALSRLLEVSSVVLRQAIDLVQNSLTSDEQLSAPSKYIPGSTIGRPIPPTKLLSIDIGSPLLEYSLTGKHLRHARDHFVLLVDSMSSPAPRTLNYDIRLRNTPMETGRKAALQALRDTIAQLEKLMPNVGLDEPITLHAVTPFPQIVHTSFGREVRFVLYTKHSCWKLR